MIAHGYAALSQVRMYYLEAGGGSDAVLLLHGWAAYIAGMAQRDS